MAVPGVLGSKADSPGLNADSRRVEAEDAALRRLIASTVIFGDKKPDFSQVTGKVEAISKPNRAALTTSGPISTAQSRFTKIIGIVRTSINKCEIHIPSQDRLSTSDHVLND